MGYEHYGIAIHSLVDEYAPRALHIPLWSNGSYIRTSQGTLLGKHDDAPTVLFLAEYFGVRHVGQIVEPHLVERINHYMQHSVGSAETNCSAFAHYLFTGELIDCRTVRRGLVLRHNMRPFEMSSRVDVGDMVGLIYQNKRVALSRQHEYSSRGRQNQKLRHQHGAFTCTASLRWQHRPISPAEFLDMHEGLSAPDFHFMVCVAKLDGEPVWLSQTAYLYPHEPPDTFAITVGLYDPFPWNVPIAAFIKKVR